MIVIQAKLGALCAASLIAIALIQPAAAQQAFRTTGATLDAPIAQTVDVNGVDLLTGMLQVAMPGMVGGDGPHAAEFRMKWNGRLWMPNAPALWIDSKDWHVYVSDGERTDEFANGVQGNDGGGDLLHIHAGPA